VAFVQARLFFADNPVDFSITVEQTLSLVLSSNSVNIELTPTRDGTDDYWQSYYPRRYYE